MSVIPHLAANRAKRAGKVEVFEIIRAARSDTLLTDVQLATLYSYFLPPAPKKINSVFDWVTLACDDKAAYAFCKYVEVKNSTLAAASTKRAHLAFTPDGLEDNWYDVHRGKVGPDVAIMPDIFKALSESATGSQVSPSELSGMRVVDTPTGLAYVLPWVNRGVNKAYFDLMFGSLGSPSITADITGESLPFNVSGTVSGVMVSAIVMPFELPDYAGGTDESD